MKALEPGLIFARDITIDVARTVSHLGEDLRVYATSALVHDVEMVCRDALLERCEPGEDSVGTGISLSHRGSALAGTSVTITARVTKVEGRRVQFECTVRDALEEISGGTHGRFVVDLDRSRERLAGKRTRLGAQPQVANKAK